MSMILEVIQGLGSILTGIITLYIWVLVAAALISFTNISPFNPYVQFIYRLTNPAYSFVRSKIKTQMNGLDFAPLVLIVFLQILIVLINAFLHNLY